MAASREKSVRRLKVKAQNSQAMRIIILNQFFYPDHSATSQLMTELAVNLVAQGVAVTAISGRGRYNGGGGLSRREVHEGVRIERAWSAGLGKRTLPGRLTDYLSFYAGAIIKLLMLDRHDIVMTLTTPPLIGLAAVAAGRIRRMRVISLVQDIYPDIAVELGALRANSLTTRIIESLNKLVLRRSDRIVALSECMRERILSKLGPSAAERVDVIHNWADGARIVPQLRRDNNLRKQNGLGERFIVLFSGNMGLVNDFDTLLTAALELRSDPNILFLFIGEGARAGEVENFALRHQLHNIKLLPYQPYESLPDSLGSGDVLMVTLKEGLAGLSMPSKIYGVLAAGKPAIFLGDPRSEAATIIAENRCGAVIAPGDVEGLVRTLSDWSVRYDVVIAMGRNARAVFETRFDRSRAVREYLRTFSLCLGNSQSQTLSPAQFKTSP